MTTDGLGSGMLLAGPLAGSFIDPADDCSRCKEHPHEQASADRRDRRCLCRAGGERRRTEASIKTANDPALSYTAPVGPLALSLRNRAGSFRAHADYGALSVSQRSRVVSLRDGLADIMPSSMFAAHRDTLRIVGPSGASAGSLIATFSFTSAMAASAAVTSAASGASGATTADFLIAIGTEPTFLARIEGFGTVTDRARTSPASSYTVRNSPGFQFGFVAAPSLIGAAIPAQASYSFSVQLPTTRDWFINLAAGCGIGLRSFRILDTNSGSCNSGLTWNGLTALTDGFGNPLDPALYTAIGASGFDYFAAPAAAQRMAFAAAAVPEPATWAMMIAGFGLVGLTMRRSRLHCVMA